MIDPACFFSLNQASFCRLPNELICYWVLRYSEDEFLSGLSNFLVNKFYGEDYGLDSEDDDVAAGGMTADELPPWRMGASPQQQQPQQQQQALQAVAPLGTAGPQPPQEVGSIDSDL